MITRPLAQRIERTIAQSHLTLTNHSHEVKGVGEVLKLPSGCAFFTGVESPFSQVIGWGFDEGDLHALEEMHHFYAQHEMPRWSIELSPYTREEVLLHLAQSGFKAAEFSQISWLPIEPLELKTTPTTVQVRYVTESELISWAACVAEGFEAAQLQELYLLYGQAVGIHPFGAWIDNTLVGGGTIAISENVADLGVTSTLPRFRGQGVQKALINTRLQFAEQQGVDIATVTTTPATISDANIQKCGFRPAYTRLRMEKAAAV